MADPLSELSRMEGDVPGLARFLTARSAMQNADQAQGLRDALSQSGGNLDQSLSALLRSGNIQGAHALAPLLKIQQEKQLRDQAVEGLKQVYAPQDDPNSNLAQVPPGTPGESSPTDARKVQLQKISTLYPQNAALQTAIQREMDKLDAEQKPQFQMISLPGNKEQLHRIVKGELLPVGSPRDIFNPSQNQVVPTPQQYQNNAVMRATGMPASQVMPGYGRNIGEARLRMNQDAIDYIAKNQGLTQEQAAEELANRDISYAGGKKSVGQLTMMQGATRAALKQLEFNVDKVSELMKSMPGSDLSPIFNAIIRQEQKWTGDPKYSALFYYMSAAGQESARIMSNGQASIAQLHSGAAEEARKWASANWTTPKAWLEGVAPAMRAEAENRLSNFEQAIKAQRSPAIAPSSAPAAAIPGAVPGKAPQAALDYLRAHPETAPQFKAKYGYTP